VDFGIAANYASDVQNLDVFVAEATLLAHLPFPLYFANRLGEFIYPEIRQFTSYLRPGALIDRLESELDHAGEARRPFFGILFTATTHLPFAASHPYNRKWVDRSYRGPNRYQIDFEVDGFIQRGFREALTPEEVRHIIDLYDGAVSEFDALVAEMLALLRRRGILDSTIIIVASDHGDDLYDPGTTLGHGTSFFGGDQTVRIPFVMRLPGGRYAGTRVPGIARTLDVAPTLLDLLGIPAPAGFEGTSLKPAIEDPLLDLALPAFAETCYLFYPKRGHPEGALTVRPADETLRIDPSFRNNFVLREEYHQPVIDSKDRMIRTGRWKLIHIPGVTGPIYRLYDMHADPSQLHDLSGENLPVMGRLAAALDSWWSGRWDIRWPQKADG
jgi:arylsulfatase A-like enzyme